MTVFWIQDSRYQNVGGKNRQFDSLQAVYDYAVRRKVLDRPDYFEVCDLAGNKAPLADVYDAFDQGQQPQQLTDVPASSQP